MIKVNFELALVIIMIEIVLKLMRKDELEVVLLLQLLNTQHLSLSSLASKL